MKNVEFCIHRNFQFERKLDTCQLVVDIVKILYFSVQELFSYFNYIGLRSISMSTRNRYHCNGRNVKIMLANEAPQRSCETQPSIRFSKNTNVTWSSYRLGDCRAYDITESTKVLVKDTANDPFCPSVVTIETLDREKYESKMFDQTYDTSTNHWEHPVQKVTPTTTTN